MGDLDSLGRTERGRDREDGKGDDSKRQLPHAKGVGLRPFFTNPYPGKAASARLRAAMRGSSS
jgi:hypothetical protein